MEPIGTIRFKNGDTAPVLDYEIPEQGLITKAIFHCEGVDYMYLEDIDMMHDPYSLRGIY